MVGERVYVATISHMYGDEVLVSATESGAENLVYEWVVNNWDRETSVPASRHDCLSLYFDGSNGASYTVEECLIYP